MGRELLGSGVSREELFELMSEYVSDGPAAASKHVIFRRLYRDTPFDEWFSSLGVCFDKTCSSLIWVMGLICGF